MQTINFSYGLTHTNGPVTVGSYVDPTGGWLGTRSNHPLYFSPTAGCSKCTLATNGNLGVGVINPTTARLQVAANDSAGIQSTSQGNAVIGFSTAPGFAAVYGENTSGSSGFGVYGKGTSGYAVYAEGNAGQSRDKGGFVKAMLYVNGDGVIRRCYNGLTGASLTGGTTSAGCGFSVTRDGSGIYGVDFNFRVDDRFLSISVQGDTTSAAYVHYNFSPTHDDRIGVVTRDSDGAGSDRPFMVIMY